LFLRIGRVFAFGTLFFLSGYTLYSVQILNQRLEPLPKIYQPFSAESLLNTYPHKHEWDVSTPAEMMNFVRNFLLRQKFYWLGRGQQSSVYLSKDGEYVIKLFPQSRHQEQLLKERPLKFLFNKHFRKSAERTAAHRERVFVGSKLCYEECPEESGIVYVHLNRTDNFLSTIKLIGPGERIQRIKGDQLSFVVQRRADYVVPTFQKLMEEGKVEEAKLRLEQIFTLLYDMAAKGLIGRDTNLISGNNIGFTKERAICIDVGAVAKEVVDVEAHMRWEFDERVAPLYDWLRIKYPALADHYQVLRGQYVRCSC
jgi:hypothetical protein